MSAEDLVAPLRGLPRAEAQRRVLDEVLTALGEALDLADPKNLGPEETFIALGFDSLRAVDFKDDLARRFGCPLRTTLVFDHPTPRAVAAHLVDELGLGEDEQTRRGEQPDELEDLSSEQLRARVRELEGRRHEPVAIVGIGCRFPGDADSPATFWSVLRDGVDAVSEVPAERFSIDRYFDPDHQAPGKIATRYGAFIKDIDRFDAPFFGMSGREARELDPRQRVLLETVWETLEHGAQSPDALRGRAVGVYVGMLSHEYFDSQTDRDLAQCGQYNATGGALSTAAGRLSHTFGWTGPSLALDTACSSSLVAVHLAVQSLRRGECDLALAGGVHALLDPVSFLGVSQANMLAADGRCKTFDAAGDGYVRSEGCGVVLLKPLSRAVEDGDRIFAVVRGTASNQDGASGGLTVPNGPSQVAVIRTALADGRTRAEEVSYVEAHGTGTALGDPIEAGAIDEVFGPSHGPRGMAVGSVKTNIGHGEPVAGIAGLLKVVLSLRNEELAPNLHFETPNPHIDWDSSVLRVLTQREPWQRGPQPRVAGVSSFGFSGTNAHVVVAEAPVEPTPSATPRLPLILPISAAGPAALTDLVERHRDALGDATAPQAADACYSAAVGRAHLPHRLVLLANGPEELARSLKDAARDPGESIHGEVLGREPAVAFLFTGQGSQVAGMARGLHESEPGFRAALEDCARALDGQLDHGLFDILWGEEAGELIDQTRYTQPALFSLEYALAQMWRGFGVEPARLLGHSVGEYVAACIAGVFSLEDALRLVAARGRLMHELTSEGDMLAVLASEDEVAPLLAGHEDKLSVAAVNGPTNIVISGEPAALAEVARALDEAGHACKPLNVSHAFHSPLIEPMLGAFEDLARSVEYSPPTIPVVSCLNGHVLGAELCDPGFWTRHVREPVRFEDGMRALAREGCDVMLEVGPSPVLCGMARRFLKQAELAWVASLQRGAEEWACVAGALAELHVLGVPLDWRAIHAGDRRVRVDLPRYPFQRERYWYERRSPAARGDAGSHPLLGGRVPSATLPEGGALFERALSTRSPAFLDDHRVFGQAIVPAAALIEMALAASESSRDTVQLEKLSLFEALAVTEADTTVQVVSEPREDAGRAISIHRLDTDPDAPQGTWTRHARGRLGDREDLPAAPSFAQLEAGEWTPIAPDDFYAAFAAAGLDYGPTFRNIRELRARTGEALARVRLGRDIDGAEEYGVHPALLDACFQTAAAALVGVDIEELFLPLAVARVAMVEGVGDELLCHTRVTQGTTRQRSVRLDLALYREGPAGLETVLVVEGLQLVRADVGALLRSDESARRLLHGVAWRPSSRSKTSSTTAGPARLVGGGELAEQLAARLSEDDNGVTDGPLEEAASVVFLAGLEATPGAEATLCGELLTCAQDLVRAGTGARLTVVTRGAQPAGGAVSPEQAALIGLARTLTLEHPELGLRCVDLDPNGGGRDELRRLAEELGGPDAETEVALRGAERLAPRLARLASLAAEDLTEPSGPFELRAESYGSLDKLALRPLERRTPQTGEVEVEVAAAALNFKDVLHAFGMLTEWSEQRGIHQACDQPLGFEGAGRVVAVGPGVEDFAVGDSVVIQRPGALATHVTLPAADAFPSPAGLTAAEAAGLPTVFQTALHALERCASLRSGERVLIHAAAGGVGQAALQVARRAGAEIHATASPSKHAFLRSQGVKHVYHSRTLDFAQAVLDATGGEGVDVVLNSLAGDFVEAGLRCLREGGRFVEIGKIGVKSEEQMATERPDVRYFLFDLSEIPEVLPELRADLLAGFAQGSFTALPTRSYPARRAAAAFSTLAQARQIGKVALTLPAGATPTPRVHAEGTYLVTGGLGALGLVAARQLVQDGARHLVLCGRGGLDAATAEARNDVAALEASGARVSCVAADVSRREDVEGLLGAIEPDMPPLVGVVHCAGVLDDGVALNLTPERFAAVLAPKLDGARHLDELTRDLPLELFVVFSSMAGLLGAPGQGNYSAANAAMDAVVQRRAALGLPALSLQWGPWARAGMAAAVASRDRARFAEMGLDSITPEEGASLFSRLITGDHAQVAVLPIRWPKFVARLPHGVTPPILEAFASEGPAATDDAQRLAADLSSASPQTRLEMLADFIGRQLTQVLGFGPSTRIDPRRNFGDLGVDSLLAVDLRNRLEAGLDLSLPATLLFDHPNLEALVTHLNGMLGDTGEVPPSEPPAPEQEAFAELSEEEVARLLAAEIDALSPE